MNIRAIEGKKMCPAIYQASITYQILDQIFHVHQLTWFSQLPIGWSLYWHLTDEEAPDHGD